MKKKFTRWLVSLLLSVFALCGILAGCAGKSFSVYDAEGNLVFDSSHTGIEVEYGTAYMLPQNVQIGGKKTELTSVALYDSNENQLTLSYGAYQFLAVGDYAVRYEAGGQNAEYTISCVDTSLPVITVVTQDFYGILGERAALPTCTYTDRAGINQDSVSMTVAAPDGSAVSVTDGTFLLEQVGNYIVTVSVSDNNGNRSELPVTVICYDRFVDEERGENVIYSFDDEQYLNLTIDLTSGGTASQSIVEEGYPAIENEPVGNKVLAVSSDKTFGDVSTQFTLHEDLLARGGYRIAVRIAVSTDTDYIKLFRNAENMDDSGLAGQMFGLKANTWYEWEIDPLAYGYNANFKDFVITFRDKGDTTLWIDEIYFMPVKFEDDMDEGVLADFDEEGYLYNVYQNVYCDPTTTRGFRVTGTDFSIESGEALPAENGDNTHAPGLGAEGSALKLVTSDAYGGMTYMFPEPVDLNAISRLTFRMYVESAQVVTVIGFFNEYGYDGGNNAWRTSDVNYAYSEWLDMDFSAEYLKQYSSADKISGFYLQVIPGASLDESYPYRQTIYIDGITTTPRNPVSEQSGDEIARFDTAEALRNVTHNTKYDTAEYSFAESVYGADGVLAVRAGADVSCSDGFTYYFDEPYTVTSARTLLIKLAANSDRVRSVNVSVINSSERVFSLGEISLGERFTGAFNRIGVSGSDILSAVTDGVLLGIRLDINVSEKSDDNFLYVDEIRFYDSSSDTDKPVVDSATAESIDVLAGETADLSVLNVSVSDPSDPLPGWYIEKLTAPDGTDITEKLQGFVFTPEAGGEYKVRVRGRDAAGNVSEAYSEISVTVNYYTDKAELYDKLLAFGSGSALSLVQSGVDPQIVDDADAVDGKALQITFKYDDFEPSGRVDATIDLGGLWKVSEIGQIVIRYKIISGNPGTWWRLYPNDITDDSRRFYGNGMTYSSSTTSQGTPTAGYETVTIPQSALKMNGGNNAILNDDDYLSSISFAEVAWRADTGWRMIIQIDSVEIQPVVGFEEDFLQFAEDNALAAVLSGVNPQIIDDPDASDGKALRAAFRSPDLDWNGKRDLKIDLGGLYKVSEIESVVIRYKIPEGYNFANYWWRIFLNDLTEDDNLRVYKQGAIIYSAATTSQGISTDGYQTITIMQEALKGNDLTPAGGTAHDLLSDDDYLTAITFAGVSARNEGERDIEFVIDSITVNLK